MHTERYITKPLIKQIKAMINEHDACNLNGILIPRKTFNFGENLEGGPWGVRYIPNAINKHIDKIGEMYTT